MKKIISFLFVFSALGLSALAVLRSDNPIANIFGTKADSFGISPPYVKNYSLKPGDTYRQNITIMRGNAANTKTINITPSADGFEDWLEFYPSKNFTFPSGKQKVVVTVAVNVPEDAVNGDYEGLLNINLGAEYKSGQVGIALGAIAEIGLKIIDGRSAQIDMPDPKKGIKLLNRDYWSRLKGRLIIRAENDGEIYYLDHDEPVLYEINDNQTAQIVIKDKAVGVDNRTIAKIPVGLVYYPENDADMDELSDNLEVAIGTNKNNPDTDGDGYSDGDEIKNNFDPLKPGSQIKQDDLLGDYFSGKFIIQSEHRGELWYVNPVDNKRYYLDDLAAWLNSIADLSMGISEKDFNFLVLKNN